MVSLIASLALAQPAGVFPFACERFRPGGTKDVVLVKDSRDKGQVLGQGSQVSQIPLNGGCAFTVDGSARVVAFDAEGTKLLDHSQLGFLSAGRPVVDPSGSFLVAEFVSGEGSELWRIPLKGKGPATMLSSINKGDGSANPSFEMDGRTLLCKVGSSWVRLDVSTGQTRVLDIRALVQDLPEATEVLEVRPSPLMPDLAAVTVVIPRASAFRWTMVWDRKTGRVSRLSPEGADCDQVDWSRDGRWILFRAKDLESGRVTLQAARPTGGDPQVIAVVKEPGS
ncbi:MAG: hypothetical protein JNM28_08775 [Armatimonadetes bacterium]|nr:hypothetical protein [Armatimonadota bacterium]MBS1710845.1 hypothetical protein [Armatimonadota bacterium]MBX3108517.1 hypothetical protein [Fimbriimonadaceae bacterium]